MLRLVSTIAKKTVIFPSLAYHPHVSKNPGRRTDTESEPTITTNRAVAVIQDLKHKRRIQPKRSCKTPSMTHFAKKVDSLNGYWQWAFIF